MLHTIAAIGGRFLRDARGGVTSICAAGVILMTLGGTALIIDHNHLVGQRDILKSAADAASMAATLHLNSQPRTLSDDDMRGRVLAFARKYAELNVLGNVNDTDLTAADVTMTFEMDRDLLIVNTTVAANTGETLISSWLYDYRGPGTITTKAGVEAIETTVEVALAIDVSWSMSRNLAGHHKGETHPDSRLAIVKRAAIDLVDVLQPSASSRIAVGVVPWSHRVRLDPTLRATWTANNWAAYPGRRYFGFPYLCRPAATCTPRSVIEDLPDTAPETWRGCFDEHRMTGDLADITLAADWFDHPSAKPFAQAIYPSDLNITYTCPARPLRSDVSFQLCYGPLHPTMPARVRGNYAPQRGCPTNRSSILPLSTERTDIVDRVNAMALDGATHSALGLLWGQRLLTPAWRDAWGDNTHPVDRGDNVRKAIVLLTDGRDTQCGGVDTDCSRTRMGYDRADVCDAIKAAGSEIFVVTAMPPHEVAGDLGRELTACSSQGTRPGTYTFLNNNDAATLRAAFASIARQLRSVRRLY